MMKMIFSALTVVALVGCSSGSGGGSSASASGTYSIAPGVTDLDSSAPAIDKASYYTVVSSSSSENKVTVGGSGVLGSFIVPAGQNFVVESKKKLQFSGPANSRLKLGGTNFSFPNGAEIKVELIWGTNDKTTFRFVGNGSSIDMYSSNISPSADGNAYPDSSVANFAYSDLGGFFVDKSNGTSITAGYFDSIGNETTALTLSDNSQPSKLATDAYMKITVTNAGSSAATFSLKNVSSTIPSVNR